MKKLIAMLLTFMILFSLTACTGTGKPSTDTTDGKDSQGGMVEKQEPEKITFEELTVVDNDECTVKITGIKENSIWGYTLSAYLENKSADKTYMFSVRDAAINGVSATTLSSKEVAPGKKANEDITFSESELKDKGIEKFTDIELLFYVYDSDDWMAEAVAEETVHVYPYGQEKAEIFKREPKDTDTVIVDNEFVSIILTDYDKDSIWGFSANVFLVNKTEKEVMFNIDDVSVNGYMVDPFWAKSVSAGKCAFSSISWSDSSLEENNITEIETIEAIFEAGDSDLMSSEEFASVNVTLNP